MHKQSIMDILNLNSSFKVILLFGMNQEQEPSDQCEDSPFGSCMILFWSENEAIYKIGLLALGVGQYPLDLYVMKIH